MAFGKKNKDDEDDETPGPYTEAYVVKFISNTGSPKSMTKVCNDMHRHGYSLVAQSVTSGALNMYAHWLTFKKEQ